MSFLIALFTVVLLLVSIFMILIILMQKAKSDGGLGAAMGGGAAESAFGAETNTVLRKGTIYCAVVFFVLSFGIYLAHQHQRYQAERPTRGIEEITPSEEGGTDAGDAEAPALPIDPEGQGMIDLPEGAEPVDPESAEAESGEAGDDEAAGTEPTGTGSE